MSFQVKVKNQNLAREPYGDGIHEQLEAVENKMARHPKVMIVEMSAKEKKKILRTLSSDNRYKISFRTV